MTDEEIRLKCLELGQAGQATLTVKNAEVYYEFVKQADKPQKRRGRPPKAAAD